MLRTTHISVKQALVQSPLQHPVTVVLLMGGRAKQPLICLQTNIFSFQFSTEEGKGECFRYSLYNLLLYRYTKGLVFVLFCFFCIRTFYSTTALRRLRLDKLGFLVVVSYFEHSEDFLFFLSWVLNRCDKIEPLGARRREKKKKKSLKECEREESEEGTEWAKKRENKGKRQEETLLERRQLLLLGSDCDWSLLWWE